MSDADCIPGRIDAQEPQPSGDIGASADRGPDGRFAAGNRAALVIGERSAAFWNAQDGARRAIERAVIADAGHTVDDAPHALRLAAQGIAQAKLICDSAFQRLVESGGPLTSRGRTRVCGVDGRQRST